MGLDASAEARPLLQRAWPACIASHPPRTTRPSECGAAMPARSLVERRVPGAFNSAQSLQPSTFLLICAFVCMRRVRPQACLPPLRRCTVFLFRYVFPVLTVRSCACTVIEAALQIGHTRRMLVSCVRKRQGRASARRPIRALFLTITSARAVGGQGHSCQLNPLNETLSPSCTLLHRLRIPAHTRVSSRVAAAACAGAPQQQQQRQLPPSRVHISRLHWPPLLRLEPAVRPFVRRGPRRSKNSSRRQGDIDCCMSFLPECHRRSSFALCAASPATPQLVAFPVPLPCT